MSDIISDLHHLESMLRYQDGKNAHLSGLQTVAKRAAERIRELELSVNLANRMIAGAKEILEGEINE